VSFLPLSKLNYNKKTPALTGILLAGSVGIGPTLAVLETAVLPLYELPRNKNAKFEMGNAELLQPFFILHFSF